jgi:DNA-binding response OmpR family regulator
MADHKTRALIVEDDENTRTLLAKAFSERKIEADIAATTLEAVRLAKSSNHYCSVVLDFMLPDGNALVVIDTIRQLEARPVVLVMTGLPQDQIPDVDPAIVQMIWRKPLDASMLADVIARMCEGRP